MLKCLQNPAQSGALNGHPRGYPSLANFIRSDRDLFVFRRVNTLSERNLLYLQDELVELEEKLRNIDLADSRNESQHDLRNLHSRREDTNIERRCLMMQLNAKLKSYRTCLCRNLILRGADSRQRMPCIPNRASWL